jgi:hypothetical protein
MPATTVPRADRATTPMAISYRVPGDDVWFQSRVINISESGVLFGPTALQPGVRVDVMFNTTSPLGSMASGQMVCSGSVVRTTETGAAAARFHSCRFVLDES